jgi:hypothetical protein
MRAERQSDPSPRQDFDVAQKGVSEVRDRYLRLAGG